MQKNGSEIMIECLIEQGVDTVFGYPGGAVLNIYDALYKNSDRIKHVLTCHEQNAAHAADGYARSTGKVGVCIATSGPGATNLVTGIATAYMDSVPMVAITGNVGCSLLGKDSFQEIDIAGVTMPITKHNYIVKDITKLADTIREAFYIANSGRKGPVLVDIPKDITAAVTDYEYVKPKKIEKCVKTINNDDIKKIAELIKTSEKPLIYAGGGIILSDASKELKAFATKTNIPVSTSLMGIGGFEESNPLSIGMIGMHGTVAANKAAMECDLLIALGARFSDRVISKVSAFAPNAKIVHFDIDPAEIGKNVKPFLSVKGDVKESLSRLLSVVEDKKNEEWLKEVEAYKNAFRNYQLDGTLRPKVMMQEINRATNGEAFITTEVGQHQMWAAQYYCFNTPKRFITSGGLGTMGYGTGAAIGVQIGNKDATVVHVAGDGSFRMNLTELATIKEYDLPIIIVLVNNQTLGMVRQWQTAFYGKRYSQTTLKERGPKFDKLCEAFEIDYLKATTIEEFSEAIDKAVKLRKPIMIETMINIDERVLPMVAPGASIGDIILD